METVAGFDSPVEVIDMSNLLFGNGQGDDAFIETLLDDNCEGVINAEITELGIKEEVESSEGEIIGSNAEKSHALEVTAVKDCILIPLTLPTGKSNEYYKTLAIESESVKQPVMSDLETSLLGASETSCMLCDIVYENVEKKEQYDEYLCHLVVEHRLVIADVRLIANLRAYAMYWKKRFLEKPLDEFCAIIKTNMSPKDMHESVEYYLLCDTLLEDREIREKLHLHRLKELITRQRSERADDGFERMCLFCTKFFLGNRDKLFNHMIDDHNFNVGHPQNLIYAEEFLNVIQRKLNDLHCLFCDKVFKDRASLREHMRKKSHRRLNPKNKLYDKYYLINYLELGKNWEVLQGEPEQFDAIEDWSGWDEEPQNAVCFFCTAAFDVQDGVYNHMSRLHGFNYPQMRKDMNLSFYQQVKMINYIRREVHQEQESSKVSGIGIEKDGCEKQIDKCRKFVENIEQSILNSTKWNQPQYYFPTYENDSLLCQLEDKEGLFEPEDTFIIGEDGIDCKSLINDSILTDLVVGGYFD